MAESEYSTVCRYYSGVLFGWSGVIRVLLTSTPYRSRQAWIEGRSECEGVGMSVVDEGSRCSL